jgi:hypothetical protein
MAVQWYDVPLNLPHATKVTAKIVLHLQRLDQVQPAHEVAARLLFLLREVDTLDIHPPTQEMWEARDAAAILARLLVVNIEQGGAGSDRLGQLVRNLFECLELGREGAHLSLRCGEKPDSLLRPPR